MKTCWTLAWSYAQEKNAVLGEAALRRGREGLRPEVHHGLQRHGRTPRDDLSSR